MSTISTSAASAVASSFRMQAISNVQTAGVSSNGSFSSQVAAIWNQPSSPSDAPGSASSANLKDHPSASSTSKSRVPGKTGTDTVSKRDETQEKSPASAGQTMQPASARILCRAVGMPSSDKSAKATGAAGLTGPFDPTQADASATGAPEPDAGSKTGAPAKPVRKLLQTTDAKSDDGTGAPASPLSPSGTSMLSTDVPDTAKEPLPGQGADGSVATAKGRHRTDDARQQAADAIGQSGKGAPHHVGNGETPGAGAMRLSIVVPGLEPTSSIRRRWSRRRRRTAFPCRRRGWHRRRARSGCHRPWLPARPPVRSR